MKIGIMQPYYLPYIGYWQLINAVDKFVVYDNIKFTKKSWIRRNRILLDGSDKMITIPVRNDSDHLDIRDRYICDDFNNESRKILNQISMSYQHAPEYSKVFPLIENIMAYKSHNLFDFIYNSIIEVSNYLEIQTEFIISSTIDMNHNLKSSDRVLETCLQLDSTQYINLIGGLNLYKKADFERKGVDLAFMNATTKHYKQFDHEFVPNLSIIDVLMFNDLAKIKALLDDYSLI